MRRSFLSFLGLLGLALALYSCTTAKVDTSTPESKRAINSHGSDLIDQGREIFRFDRRTAASARG